MPDEFAWVSLTDGRRALVRNGYLPARAIPTTEGSVEAQVPKVRDRSGAGAKLNSALAPPYLCRSARVAAAPPWPYPKGISSGDLGEALAVLVGEDAKGLSPPPWGARRPRGAWSGECQGWTRRDLAGKHFACRWADGDVALGFWMALDQVYPPSIGAAGSASWATSSPTSRSRCKARRRPISRRSGWQRPARRPTRPARASSTATRPSTPRPPRSSRRIARPRGPSSTFRPNTGGTCAPPTPSSRRNAPVCHSTSRAKDCVTGSAFLGLAFKKADEAGKTWRRLRAPDKVAELLAGVCYQDGMRVPDDPPDADEEQREAA